MTKEKLKSEFHKLIDNIEDKKLLENFYEAISEYSKKNNSVDIIHELTEKQRARLINSIGQVSEEDTISNDQMKSEIKKWLTK
jgi:hypothetical protein